MKNDMYERLKSVPAIFRVIIVQAARRRAVGVIDEERFRGQMDRLAAEELTPRGLELLIRDRENGGLRFIVKGTRTRKVCDMIDFTADGRLEEGFDMSLPTS